jgi:hypothetical protein
MMKNPIAFVQRAATALIFVCIFFASTESAAFVLRGEKDNTKREINALDMQEATLQLALMSNKEIEAITGKKLTFKEKAGLYFFRKQMKKQNSGYFKKISANNDKCFTMYLKNGDVIEVKLIQITTTEIKYQRCNKPGDPEIFIAKSDVFSIKDADGDVIYSSKDDSWKRGMGASNGETDGLALASGITGIAAVTLGLFLWPLGLAAGIAAGVMGIISLRRLKDNQNLKGEGWAITGIVAAGLWLIFGILILIALASGW